MFIKINGSTVNTNHTHKLCSGWGDNMIDLTTTNVGQCAIMCQVISNYCSIEFTVFTIDAYVCKYCQCCSASDYDHVYYKTMAVLTILLLSGTHSYMRMVLTVVTNTLQGK